MTPLLIQCSQYTSIRNVLFNNITNVIPDFVTSNDFVKFNILLTNSRVAKNVEQFIVNAFDERPIQ